MQFERIKKSIVYLIILVGLTFLSNSVIADDDEYEGKYKNQEFVQGIVVKIDGKPYYFHGMPVGDDGATDVPGHSWVQTGKRSLLGRHENTNQFWSTDAEEGELLYIVKAVIDTWSEIKAAKYYAKGFTHYHHMVSAKTGMPHPKKVAWLKHVAVSDFELNAGPHLEYYHTVEPGVDFRFIPTWETPYVPMPHMMP